MVFRCDTEPSILALLRAVKLAWTGDVVQETSAESDPQSNGSAESSVNVVTGHVDQAGGGVCLMPPACIVGFQWVETARQYTKEMWEGALFLLGTVR